MHRPSNKNTMVLCTLSITCRIHGHHRLMVGGVDEVASVAAEHLKALFDADGFPTEIDTVRIPLDVARRMARDGFGDDDDRSRYN